MTPESGESESKKNLLLEVLRHLREQGKFPEVGAFRGSHSNERGAIDGLVQEGHLEPSQGYYRLTLDGLLRCGVREAEEEFARFDRVLPYLKEAYRQDARNS